jgi:3-hydroxybutyryl-CoA dehydrogenase
MFKTKGIRGMLPDANLNKQIEWWALTTQEKKLILSKIHPLTNDSLLSSCDLVIEATSERLEVKKQVFHRLECAVRKETILATNTATLSLTEIGESTQYPGRVIGMHFLIPPGQIDLVEIVRGLKTSEAVYLATKHFVEDVLDKKSIQVYESPGYVTSRLICVMINEAIHTLTEGVATSEEIDTAMKIGYHFHFGPLEMADRFGLDSLLAAMETLSHEFGDIKYRPNFLLKKMVRAGHLGLKTGEGFFRYSEGGERL